jgi:hypothetical protein
VICSTVGGVRTVADLNRDGFIDVLALTTLRPDYDRDGRPGHASDTVVFDYAFKDPGPEGWINGDIGSVAAARKLALQLARATLHGHRQRGRHLEPRRRVPFRQHASFR